MWLTFGHAHIHAMVSMGVGPDSDTEAVSTSSRYIHDDTHTQHKLIVLILVHMQSVKRFVAKCRSLNAATMVPLVA